MEDLNNNLYSKKPSTLKFISSIIWFILFIFTVFAAFIGMWVIAKIWPAACFIGFGVCIVACILDFIVFRKEQKEENR